MYKNVNFRYIGTSVRRYIRQTDILTHRCTDVRLKGFTLVEMAMVLVIIGLVILIVYPALNAVRASTQSSLSDSNMLALVRATAVYVQTNGCVPCPAPATVSGAGFGRVRGDATGAACGGCAQPEGIPPFVSLGVSEATARDGWGRWITMRVDPALTVNFGVIPPTTPCTALDVTNGICTQAGTSQKGLCRSGLGAAGRITIQTPNGPAQQAAVVFVSHGANGYGAFNANAKSGALNGTRLKFPATAPACSATGGFEMCNADGNSAFVNAPQKVGTADAYDDTVVFLDRNNLVSLFANGSCQTVW